MKYPWIAELRPTAEQSPSTGSVLPAQANDVATRVGVGPAGWAVELGALMAAQIFVEIPELTGDVIAAEVRKGCEAVALSALSALAEDRHVTMTAAPEVLSGPTEVVARGIGIEYMLRSIHIAHATAAHVILDAAQRLIPESQRFTEMRRVNDVLFTIVGVLTKHMAREYGRAHRVWLTSSAALRTEVVEGILRGDVVSPQRAARVLGYDLTRCHIAVIVWIEGGASSAELAQLHTAADNVLAAALCASTVVLPVGAQQVWAWGARATSAPELPGVASWRPEPGVKISVGLPATGIEGFRRSHHQAVHAARIGALSIQDRWLFRYDDLDVVAMLSTDISAAREFTIRELGALAGPGESAATIRRTLKRYLDLDRSLVGTAAGLHVARNTVAYRVQRAEQLRGRPVNDRRMQLHAALALAEELGDAVLPSAAD